MKQHKETIPLLGLHHTANRCRDAEETRAFYEDFLGLPLACSLRRDRTETGVETPLLHIFFQMRDGSYLAFFELPEVEFEFKEQDPSDLHIALEVCEVTMKAMYEKAKAAGQAPFGPAELEALRSIYFRDPNGYVVELTTKKDEHDEVMDPERNDARGILDRWQTDKGSA
ncbi:VOC family protein [Enhygromyxa salina]|uniref:VOC family protein n=1 Tax=Enhygromyxa salina TaxID=215803 RepID=UPI0004E75082|nr:VOC family protein [Enhygromyxa salina]